MRTADCLRTWEEWASFHGSKIWEYRGIYEKDNLLLFADFYTEEIFYDRIDPADMSIWLGIGALAARELVDVDISTIVDLVCKKQRDYGKDNILKFSHKGIAVRLSDKIARASNLLSNRYSAYTDESLSDTFIDIVGYCIIALMLSDGSFFVSMSST